MDEQLKDFLDDIVAVWHKHGLSFSIGAYERLEVTEFYKPDVRELYETTEDGRIEVLAQKAAENERARLIYERDHAEEISVARTKEQERRKIEEDYALVFIARAQERQKLIKR